MATRRPENSLGWLMVGMGAAIGLGAFLQSYAGYAVHGGIGGRQLGADRGIAEQPDVGAGRRPARDVPAPAVPGRPPAVAPVAVVRARSSAASLVIMCLTIVLAPGKFGDEAGSVRGLPEPARRRSAPPGAHGRDRQPRHAPDRRDRFARRAGATVPPLDGDRTAPAAVAGDGGDVRGGPLHASRLLIGCGRFVGREPARLDDRPPERLGLLVRLDPDRDRRVGAAVPPVRHRRRDQPRAALRDDRRVHHRRLRRDRRGHRRARREPRRSGPVGIAAAAIVAIAFQPVRSRAQRFADRLVYGERAAPYEVLSEFSERLGNAYANEELLPRMARALAGGTGAVRADVWVRIGDRAGAGGDVAVTTRSRCRRSPPRRTTRARCRRPRCGSRSGTRASSWERCRS